MNSRPDPLLLVAPSPRATAPRPAGGGRPPPLGQILVDIGALAPGDMLRAVAKQRREDARLGDVLLANGMVTQDGLLAGLATQFGCEIADLDARPADIRLVDTLGADACLRMGLLPWRRAGSAVIVATSRPEDFSRHRPELEAAFGPVRLAVASEATVQRALLRLRRNRLAALAEARVAPAESCRGWAARGAGRLALAGVIGLAAAALAWPHGTALALSVAAIAVLVINTGVKCAAGLASLAAARRSRSFFSSRRGGARNLRLPMVSMLVPLHHERAIAARLVARLSRLNYPRSLLDVCLVVEADDNLTRAALEAANLPAWMRQVVVPPGSVRTKPRALNYALDFCRGSIVGIYDAEDAPEPDQLFKVARRFHEAQPEVACLQGVLDFYNSRANWLSRCFTVEYATWFRVVLPGLERLGFAIPLGGTTLFFRRSVLEEIGRWDAHNVTEDADLGIRLARRGYRTELIATLTEEEANCRPLAWIRQRSRWLKGYAMTWTVHMAQPRRLWADLGPRRFLGFQLLFLGGLAQSLLGPVMWSFWALPLGLPHPLTAGMSAAGVAGLTALFLGCEAVTLTVNGFGVATQRHRWLWPWIPTLHLYFPLAALAGYKAVWEMIARPFYWDKTAHGVFDVPKVPAPPAPRQS